MYVCLYVCMHVCMHVCMYVFVCLYVFVYLFLYSFICVYIYIQNIFKEKTMLQFTITYNSPTNHPPSVFCSKFPIGVHSLQLTAKALKISRGLQKETIIPTIHFSGAEMLGFRECRNELRPDTILSSHH